MSSREIAALPGDPLRLPAISLPVPCDDVSLASDDARISSALLNLASALLSLANDDARNSSALLGLANAYVSVASDFLAPDLPQRYASQRLRSHRQRKRWHCWKNSSIPSKVAISPPASTLASLT